MDKHRVPTHVVADMTSQAETFDTEEPGLPDFGFDNSFARKLEEFYVPWQAAQAPEPRLLKFNHALAVELGLDADALDTPAGTEIFAGNRVRSARARWPRPMPGTSSAASRRSSVTGGRFYWARSSIPTATVGTSSSRARAAHPSHAAATARPRSARSFVNT